MQQILPVLDNEKLQQSANDFAMKGATETLKEFYSGYNSPYRKAIDEKLKEIQIGWGLTIPDIIANINESLSSEIDKIANQALAQSFVPLVNRFLTRLEKQVKFSDILKNFIEGNDSKDYDDYSCEVKDESRYKWLDVTLSSNKNTVQFTLHIEHKTEKEKVKLYSLLGLPRDNDKYNKQVMKLSVEGGATLELPFTKDLLKDHFLSYCAKLIMFDCDIIMDCDDFDEESMFERECHC